MTDHQRHLQALLEEGLTELCREFGHDLDVGLDGPPPPDATEADVARLLADVRAQIRHQQAVRALHRERGH